MNILSLNIKNLGKVGSNNIRGKKGNDKVIQEIMKAQTTQIELIEKELEELKKDFEQEKQQYDQFRAVR